MSNIIAAAWNDFYKLKNHKVEEKNYNDVDEVKLICIDCKGKNFNYNLRQDETICINCGLVQTFNFKFTRGNMEYLPDTSGKIKKSIYKHQDYLNRKLDELSCARIKVKDEIFENIIYHLKGKKANVEILKKILRKINMKQKFLQIPTILYTLYPDEYPPLKLCYSKRHKLEKMFLKYIDTFFILKNKDQIKRKNLLNYNFVFNKLFKILGLKIMSHYFILPKGRKTIQDHEKIWKKIEIYNKWI